MINKLVLSAATNRRLEELVSRSALTRGVVRRYVAGTTVAEAIAAAQQLNREGIDVSLDLLGETVDSLDESAVAAAAYVETINVISDQAPGATISIKLSQLGIGLDPAACAGHLRQLLKAADSAEVQVEVDMEHSSVGPQTLEAFRSIVEDYPATRVAIQAAMRRTPTDLDSFTGVKPRIRLVKGAFLEPISKALQDKKEITAQYRHLSEWALAHLPDPAFGTHDDECINHVKLAAGRLGVGHRDFEIQMLYGVRRELQRELAADGYRIRVYVPFGTRWYPYLMRRMAERPANLLFFVRSLLGD